MDIGRSMPYSLDAEQAVLGCMLIDDEAVGLVLERLKTDDFYIEQHRQIFDAMVELFNLSRPVDIVTLSDQLDDKLEAIGGVDYLVHLSEVPTSANLRHYIDIVEGKSILRKLIRAANEIAEMSYAEEEEVSTILDRSEQKIFEILENRGSRDFSHIKDAIFESIMRLEELRKKGSKITGIPTGFTELDYKLAGLQNSDLIFIAARPSMGKTSFALNIAQNAAVKSRIPVAIFSLEMSKEQLVNRMIWSEALIESEKMRTGSLTPEDMKKIAHALGKLTTAPIYIDDTPGISVSEIRAKCRRLKLEKNIGLVVIDYLQLMQGTGRAENRVQEISEISRSLKILAKELNIPIITLSQLSRATETRSDKHPMLSDLRESGAIEQDADIVMFLYRDEYYNPDTAEPNVAECIVAKHRNGPVGTIKLGWRGEFTKFMNLEYNR